MNRRAMKPSNSTSKAASSMVWIRGALGAVVGAVVGFLLFRFLLGYGLYAGLVPGAFVGIGFSMIARSGNLATGLLCGAAGLIFGFWSDAATNDPPENLIHYFQTFNQVPMANKVMMTLGGFMSFWFGKGRG